MEYRSSVVILEPPQDVRMMIGIKITKFLMRFIIYDFRLTFEQFILAYPEEAIEINANKFVSSHLTPPFHWCCRYEGTDYESQSKAAFNSWKCDYFATSTLICDTVKTS